MQNAIDSVAGDSTQLLPDVVEVWNQHVDNVFGQHYLLFFGIELGKYFLAEIRAVYLYRDISGDFCWDWHQVFPRFPISVLCSASRLVDNNGTFVYWSPDKRRSRLLLYYFSIRRWYLITGKQRWRAGGGGTKGRWEEEVNMMRNSALQGPWK